MTAQEKKAGLILTGTSIRPLKDALKNTSLSLNNKKNGEFINVVSQSLNYGIDLIITIMADRSPPDQNQPHHKYKLAKLIYTHNDKIEYISLKHVYNICTADFLRPSANPVFLKTKDNQAKRTSFGQKLYLQLAEDAIGKLDDLSHYLPDVTRNRIALCAICTTFNIAKKLNQFTDTGLTMDFTKRPIASYPLPHESIFNALDNRHNSATRNTP